MGFKLINNSVITFLLITLGIGLYQAILGNNVTDITNLSIISKVAETFTLCFSEPNTKQQGAISLIKFIAIFIFFLNRFQHLNLLTNEKICSPHFVFVLSGIGCLSTGIRQPFQIGQ